MGSTKAGHASNFLRTRERTVAGPDFSRWLIPPAALAVHLCIGQVYATSVYKTALVTHFGTSLTAIGVIFSIAIVVMSVRAKLVFGWSLVGIPLAYGVWQTLVKTASLFTG